jgi:hypothetical protein
LIFSAATTSSLRLSVGNSGAGMPLAGALSSGVC